MHRLFPALIAVLLISLTGCQQQAKTVMPVPAGPPPILLRAYINVSSGCQAPTIEFMQGLRQKYPRLQLELVDFGDGGAGLDRWQQSGYKCMTLEIDGHSVVKYPVEGKMKAVAFHMPAGFSWEHEDLAQAVAAAMAGKLQPATEEEAMEGVSPEQMKAKVDELKKTKATKLKAAGKKQ